MEYTSGEESGLSEIEINEYKDRSLEKLQSGKYQLMNVDGTLKCPFCPDKKKQVYGLDDLLQHANGVGRGSLKRNVKRRAKHLAFAMFMEACLAKNLDPTKWPQEPASFTAENNEHLYCWPWTGIIVNITSDTWSRNTGYWFEALPKYKPVKVEIGFGDQSHTEKAVVEFEGDWTGFRNAVEFVRSFEFDGRGKKEWNECRSKPGLDVYGWLASADEYYSEGPLGEYIRSKTKLRSLCDVVNEEKQDKESVVVDLNSDIEMAVENLDDSLPELIDETESLSWVLEESKRLHQEFLEETRRRQRLEHDVVQHIFEENKEVQCEMEIEKKVTDQFNWELSQRVAVNEPERQKPEEEENQNGDRNSSLLVSLMEQKKAKESILRLVEQHKRDYEEEMRWYLQLQKRMEEQHELELELIALKGKLQVMKHLVDDNAVKEKMKDIMKQLKEKDGALAYINSFDQVLIDEEWNANAELQMAQQVLIEELEDHSSVTQVNVGVKRMGEIEHAVFVAACKQKLSADEAEAKADELTAFWKERLKNPEWYPFKVLEVNGEPEGTIHEDDEDMKDLRGEWGDDAHRAVVIALLDLNDYNPSGRSPVKELWNFKEGRRATMKECIIQILKDMKTPKTG